MVVFDAAAVGREEGAVLTIFGAAFDAGNLIGCIVTIGSANVKGLHRIQTYQRLVNV